MASKKNCVTTSLYIPNEIYDDLTRYMEMYQGSTYGRNGVIVHALKEFLDKKKIVVDIVNQANKEQQV